MKFVMLLRGVRAKGTMFEFKYFCEFVAKFKNYLKHESGIWD
jgi:hypothetical protein